MSEIIPFGTFDDGIEFRFRGIERDEETGEPIGEMLDITLTVPPLNLWNLRRLEKNFGALQEAASISAMQDLIQLLVAALSQNYKGVPRWLVEQSINPSNFPDLAVALMDVSGLKRKEIQEKKALAGTQPPASPK